MYAGLESRSRVCRLLMSTRLMTAGLKSRSRVFRVLMRLLDESRVVKLRIGEQKMRSGMMNTGLESRYCVCRLLMSTRLMTAG